MQIGTFRKNVMKTVSVKPSKLGLRTVAKNTVRTHLARATVALATHTGQLIQALSQFVLGLQLSQEMKDEAVVALGDIGYDLTVLGRVLKVKLPASTKKSKLVGTRAAALLQLNGQVTNLLHLVSEGTFAGPKMTTMTKLQVMPNKGGAKEERQIEIVDVAAETALEEERQAQMRLHLSGVVDVYWRLVFDLTGKPPATVFDAKFQQMQIAYQGVTFDTAEEAETEDAPETTPEKETVSA